MSTPTVVVFLEGGVVSTVMSDHPVDVIVMDSDVSSDDAESVVYSTTTYTPSVHALTGGDTNDIEEIRQLMAG